MPRLGKLVPITSAVLLAASACGGGKNAAPPVPVTASATLGPAGGSLGVTGSDGARFDLAVPAGALRATTALTLTAEPPEAGQRFHLVLGPPGVAFDLGSPATLTIQPAGAALPATGGLRVDGAAVPFDRGAGGALSVRLRGSSALAARTSGAVRAAALDVTLAACGTPTASSNGVTGADTVDLALYAQCMQAAVDQLDATGRYDDAVRASLSVAALLQRIGGNGAGDAQTFLDAATATACRARGAAFSLAAGVTISDVGEVFTFMRPMAYWEAVTQRLGASCGGQATFSDAAGALTTKAVQLYESSRPQVQNTAGARYHATVVEAEDARQVRGEVTSLQPPAAVAAVVDAQVKDRAERTLLDTLLDGPWTACRSGGDLQPLMAVMDALGSPEAARDLAQYCSVSVTVEALGPAPASASLGRAGPLGDASRSARTIRGSVKAAVNGALRLSGTARALACPAGLESPEALVLSLNGHEVRRLTDPSYLGNPLTLDLTSALQAAGLDPTHPPASLLLTVARDGDACLGYWGANPAPLLSIDLAPSDRIAFTCDGAISRGICTIDPDGSGQVQITADGLEPAWSPDRARIAFLTTAFGLSIVRADGSGRVDLGLLGGLESLDPTWSPDGAQLAFTQLGVAKTVCTVKTDGSALHCLPYRLLAQNDNGYQTSSWTPRPRWSPDGTRFAVTGLAYAGAGPPATYEYNQDLFLVNVDGSAVVNLTRNTAFRHSSTQPAWSPDGTRLAFVEEDSAAGATADVYVMTVGGGGRVQLTTTGRAGAPTWSPDGTRVAYTDFTGASYRTLIVNADGTGLPSEVAPGWDPAW